MTFEDNVEKGLLRCLAAAGAVRDPAFAGYDGVSLLVALSGGIDSSALLHALKSIAGKSGGARQGRSRLGIELSACHVNHKLRGADSAADEQYCREICENLSVPLTVVSLGQGGDSEAELRSARYEKLIRVAKQQSAPYIVTAHNLDDQVETLFFRLVRGSSLRGLVGMDPARPLDTSMWPILLRPLLQTSRQEIEAYLAKNNIGARIDGSNTDVRYSRNFLRSQVIAPLKERFPGMADHVENFRQTLQAENDYMAEQAAALLNRALTASKELLLPVLDGEHPALVARVITAFIEEAGIAPSFQRVNRVMRLIESALADKRPDFAARASLGQNLEILVSKDSILLKPLYELTVSDEEIEARLQAMAAVAVKMPRPGRSSATTMVPWLDFAVSVAELSPATDEMPGSGPGGSNGGRSALAVPVDLTDLQAPVFIRPRRAGDHLQPLGMAEQVRLKQYLHANKSLFAGARALLPALNDVLALRLFPVLTIGESQEVVWVPGFGLSEKIKGGGRPSHMLSLVPLHHDVESSPGTDESTC